MPRYRRNQKKGDFRIQLFPRTMGSAVTFTVSQNHTDPAIQEVLRDLAFRQALSLAINREEINRMIFFDLGIPAQLAPLPSTSFYKEGWREHFSQYDPKSAGDLLDGMGMTRRSEQDFRTRPDGKSFSLTLEFSDLRTPEVIELIQEYWEAIGIRTIVKSAGWVILSERIRRKQAMVWLHPSDSFPASDERGILMNLWQWQSSIAMDWQKWLSAKERLLRGVSGELPSNWRRLDAGEILEGEKPPDDYLENLDRQELFLEAEVGTPEYIELGGQIFDFWVESLYRIGTVGEVPKVMLVNNGLGNVLPPGWVKGKALDLELMGQWYDQLFWKQDLP
jgi:peptide/nickel transport system substrate-binding protein